MKKVTRSLVLVSAVTFLPVAIESTPASATTPEQASLASAIAPERIGIPNFFCKSLETRFGVTNVDKLALDWKTVDFKPSGYDIGKRCVEVSNRIEEYEKDGTIYNLTKGYINRMPVLCVGETPQATKCRSGSNKGLVLTLSPKDDASRKLQKLKESLLAAKAGYYEATGCKKYDRNVVNNLHSNGSVGKIELLNNLDKGGEPNKPNETVVALYHPQSPDQVFATWNYKPNQKNLLLGKDGKQINITDDWGIQIISSNGTKSCVYPLKMVSRLDNEKFSTTTLNIWAGTTPPPPPPAPPEPIVIKAPEKRIKTGLDGGGIWMNGEVTINPDGNFKMKLHTRRHSNAGASGVGRLIVTGKDKDTGENKDLYTFDFPCGIHSDRSGLFGVDQDNTRDCPGNDGFKAGQIPKEVLQNATKVEFLLLDHGGKTVFYQFSDFLVSETDELAQKIKDDPLSTLEILLGVGIKMLKFPLKTATEIAGIEDKFGHKTNKWDQRARLEQDGWQVVYLKEVDLTEYGKIGTAVAADFSVAAGSATAAYWKGYVKQSFILLLDGVQEKASKDIKDKIEKSFSSEMLVSLLSKKGGTLSISGIDLDVGIADYSRAECNPFGCIPSLPSYQPYVRFKLPGIAAGW